MKELLKNRSLLIKLLAGGISVIFLIGVLWRGATYYFSQQTIGANEVRANAYRISVDLLRARMYEKEFMLYDLRAKEFYEYGETIHMKEHKTTIDSLQKQIEELAELYPNEKQQIIVELRDLIQIYDAGFDRLLAAYQKKGFEDYGAMGEMREAALEIERHLDIIHDHDFQIELLEMRRDEKDFFLRLDNRYIDTMNSHLQNLKNAVSKGRGEQYISALEDLNAYETAFRNVVSIMEEIGRTEESGLQGTFERNFQPIEPVLERILQESVSASANALKLEARTGLAFLLFGVLTGGILFYFLARSITTRLKIAVDIAEQVASGDLTVEVPSMNGRDEVDFLLHALQRMVSNLRDQTHQIMEGVNALASSSSEISVTVTQLASGASETGIAVDETATTMEELKQTAQSSSVKAREVADAAQQTADVSQKGKKATDDTIERIGDIQERMASISESIMRLSEQSQTIGELIGAVNDLADQSNLLAVNAAIEASKAGEQGKGFSVVAQEIRSLAEQSKEATIQVQRLLTDIQGATGTAVMAAEQGGKAVEAGVKQSAQAEESILSLANSIMQSAQVAAQIAVANQQQVTGIEQVTTAMENIKQATTQNSGSMKQLETTAKSLAELGQGLKESAKQYTV